MKTATTPEEALKDVKSGDHVFVHTAGATPSVLTKAMTARHEELKNVEIYHLHTEGEAFYAKPELADSFHVNSFFLGANCRVPTAEGYADFIPCFLSEIPIMLRNGIINIDVALIHVSPPGQAWVLFYGDLSRRDQSSSGYSQDCDRSGQSANAKNSWRRFGSYQQV